jgi:hypothetical protein
MLLLVAFQKPDLVRRRAVHRAGHLGAELAGLGQLGLAGSNEVSRIFMPSSRIATFHLLSMPL